MVLDIFYITLIVFAIIAIQTSILRNAIIYLAVFSMLSSVIYLLLGAPDVAIAEAVIGCTLSTVLYLVALKKYRIFTIYYKQECASPDMIDELKQQKDIMKQSMRRFSDAKELQLDLINTTIDMDEVQKSSTFDIFIVHTTGSVTIYGFKQSYQFQELSAHLEQDLYVPIDTVYLDK